MTYNVFGGTLILAQSNALCSVYAMVSFNLVYYKE